MPQEIAGLGRETGAVPEYGRCYLIPSRVTTHLSFVEGKPAGGLPPAFIAWLLLVADRFDRDPRERS